MIQSFLLWACVLLLAPSCVQAASSLAEGQAGTQMAPDRSAAADVALARLTSEEAVRLQRLATELRCLVCQNESLADSNAQLASDLRHEMIARIQAGESDGDIRSFMVSRYGDFILYEPPFKAKTWALWLLPPLLLVIGFVMLIRKIARSQSPGETASRE